MKFAKEKQKNYLSDKIVLLVILLNFVLPAIKQQNAMMFLAIFGVNINSTSLIGGVKMKQVYVIVDDRTNDNVAVFSSLKRARTFVSRREDSKWLVIEYHTLL